MKNELQYERNTSKLYDDLRERAREHHSSCTVHTTIWLTAFCRAATIKFPQLHKFPNFSPTLRLFTDFVLTRAEFSDISRFPEIAGKVLTLNIHAGFKVAWKWGRYGLFPCSSLPSLSLAAGPPQNPGRWSAGTLYEHITLYKQGPCRTNKVVFLDIPVPYSERFPGPLMSSSLVSV